MKNQNEQKETPYLQLKAASLDRGQKKTSCVGNFRSCSKKLINTGLNHVAGLSNLVRVACQERQKVITKQANTKTTVFHFHFHSLVPLQKNT